MFKVLVLLVVALSVSYAAVAVYKLAVKPEKYNDQEGCYIEELDIMLAVGQSAASKKACMSYDCQVDAYRTFTCGAYSLGPSCTVVEDSEKPYPGCCPQPECPEDN